MDRLKKHRKWIFSFFAGFVTFSIFSFAAYYAFRYELENSKRTATGEVELVVKEIENLINIQLYRSRGLTSYYSNAVRQDTLAIDTYVESLYGDNTAQESKVFRSLGILKDTTIIYVYPEQGNQKSLGVDLATIPGQKDSVLKVKNSLATVVDAPVNLVQGGRGVIIRMPLTEKLSLEESKYYGQMSVVIDYDRLAEVSKLNQLMLDYKIQLINNQAPIEAKRVIYSNTDQPISGGKTYRFNFPNVDWTISYIPKTGWVGTSPLFYSLILLGSITSFIVGLLVVKQLGTNESLNIIVDERTSALIRTNEYLEQTLAEVEEKQAELYILNDQLEDSLEHLKETQEQLMQAEKFAALGELVAGVAHEINTPLGIGITLATFVDEKHAKISKQFEQGQLSKTELHEYNESVTEALKVMVSSLNRSAEIIGSFKNVAGEQSSLELRYFNVKEYFEDVLQNLKPKLKKTPHEVLLNCDSDIVIYHYPGAFSHILTNFIINSLVHAFPENHVGHITIDFTKENNLCKLIYKDDGIGISEKHLSHVFDPFYTTKKGEGSTGLGLHIVHNIVTQNLNGQIYLTTSEQLGVRFEIVFPTILPEDYLS